MAKPLTAAVGLLLFAPYVWAQPDDRAATSRPATAKAHPATSRPASWVCVTPKAAFSPRDTAEDLVYADKMWLSNAWHPPQVLTRDLWCSTDGVTWTLVSAETPYDGYSEMVAYHGKMWAIKDSVWCSTDGRNWRRVCEHTPFGARGYGEAVVHRDRIWQLGSGPDVWCTDDGVNWTQVARKAPYGDRSASAVAVFDDKLWLMAGRTPEPNTPPEKGYKTITTHNDVWCSPDGKDWTRVLEHAPWAPREWSVSKAYCGKMWLIGGHDNVNSRNLGDVWYTEDGKEWHKFVSPTEFSPRHEVSSYVYDGSLWVVAGNSWPVQNDVWRLSLPCPSSAADDKPQ